MDKKTAGLIGAIAGLATMGVAHAATTPVPNPSEALHASSYADLLAPVENAVAVMKADNVARAQQPIPEGDIELAQYYGPPPAYHHHHHHHHHHAYYRRHHHHHHHNTVVAVPGIGVVIGNR